MYLQTQYKRIKKDETRNRVKHFKSLHAKFKDNRKGSFNSKGEEKLFLQFLI